LVAAKETQSAIREISGCPVVYSGLLAGGSATCLRFKIEETTFSVLNTQTNSIGASDSLN
jgi:hypothetical protein